jgi:hypothetical protein
VEWLGFVHKNIFDGKSAFKLMQTFGDSIFTNTTSNPNATLVLNNKKVHDTSSIIKQIKNRVGRGDVVLSTCALCFEDVPSTKLVPACGRSGCAQLVDESCLHEWVRIYLRHFLVINLNLSFSTVRTRRENSST